MYSFVIFFKISWRGPSEHAAQLIGLSDRILLFNGDKRNCFILHKYLLSSLISLHFENQSAAFRTLFATFLRLSAFLEDHTLFTALLWLALFDSRWSQTASTQSTPKTILQRPLANCLHNIFEYQPYWKECKGETEGLSSLVKSILSHVIKHTSKV